MVGARKGGALTDKKANHAPTTQRAPGRHENRSKGSVVGTKVAQGWDQV